MSRRRAASKREILPDPKFGSELLSRFINQVMVSGKKSIAEKIVYGALVTVEQKSKDKIAELKETEGSEGGDGGGAGAPVAIKILSKAIDQVSPTVEVRSRRVGGATYQIPVEVRPERRRTLGMRWLIEAAKQRNEKSMALRLGYEILDALMGRGIAVKKREDVHKMAKANQAFAHYRW